MTGRQSHTGGGRRGARKNRCNRCNNNNRKKVCIILDANVEVDFLIENEETTDDYEKAKVMDQSGRMMKGDDYLEEMCYLSGCNTCEYELHIDDHRTQYAMENDQYPGTVEKAMTMPNKNRYDDKRQWIDDYGSDQWNNGRANEKNEHRHLQTEEDIEGVSGGGFVWSHCMIEKNDVSIMRRERDDSFLEKENEELLDNILQDSSSTMDIIEDDDFVKNVKQSAMNMNGVSM